MPPDIDMQRLEEAASRLTSELKLLAREGITPQQLASVTLASILDFAKDDGFGGEYCAALLEYWRLGRIEALLALAAMAFTLGGKNGKPKAGAR